jgi:hypothetical protein
MGCLAGAALLACARAREDGSRVAGPSLPATIVEFTAATHDPHASVFERRGETVASCREQTLALGPDQGARVRACPGSEDFAREPGERSASPAEREMWWALAREHSGDCRVLRNAAGWLASGSNPELDRRLAPEHPDLVRRYKKAGVVATVASSTRSLEAVQCASKILGVLPSELDSTHGLWLYRAGWIYLYAGKMGSYQRVHAELAKREGALDRFVFTHLRGLEAIRAGDTPLAERLLMHSVRRRPTELHESLAGASLLVREFWVRERVDVVVDYLETYAQVAGDERWAQTTLERVLAGELPDDGWL